MAALPAMVRMAWLMLALSEMPLELMMLRMTRELQRTAATPPSQSLPAQTPS